ncbi:hypothetical protein ACVIHH_003674 [Bradyrhizobium sp. USDA 4518]
MTAPILKVAPYRRLSPTTVAFRLSLVSPSGGPIIEIIVPVELTFHQFAWPIVGDGDKQRGMPPIPEAVLLLAVEEAKQVARRFSESVFAF